MQLRTIFCIYDVADDVLSVATSDVFGEISDVWCYGDKSDVDWADIFVYHISSHFRIKINLKSLPSHVFVYRPKLKKLSLLLWK